MALFATCFTSKAHAAGIAPTAPTNIVATPASASIVVTWGAPAYPGDGVNNYSVDYSTDGSTWTNSSNTISSAARTYTINSLTPGTPYYIRMTAINAAGTSPYGYPWTKLYSTSTSSRDSTNAIVYDAGGGLGVSDSASVLATASFTRVKYHLQADYNSVTNYADADMAKWSSGTVPNPTYGIFTSQGATISNLRIPDLTTGNSFIVDTNVADLTVVSSLSTLNVSQKIGRLEIWPWDYNVQQSGLPYPGDNSTFDYDDSPSLSNSYGSFQVHDVSDAKTILAWNRQLYGGPSEVGIGPGPGAQPDWTFCSNTSQCGSRTNFHVEISINVPVAPTVVLTTTVALSGASTAIFRTSTTITATASTTGKVTFYANGKRIPGCINVLTLAISPFTAVCNWKPAQHSPPLLTAKFTPNTGLTSTSTAIKPIVSARSNNR
jgi:hypothetical protein